MFRFKILCFASRDYFMLLAFLIIQRLAVLKYSASKYDLGRIAEC